MRARPWLLTALVAAACGDNLRIRELPDGEPLGPASELTIVAHQDDDLLFMQPDLYDSVQRAAGLTNVYVTAGNGRRGVEASEVRHEALLAAYSAIVGAARDDWSCGWIELAGHAAEHCRLAPAALSLVFLGYPDGGKEGEYANSLLHLWEAKVERVDTIARRPTTYDQRGLIATLAAVIDATAPATLRTLEVAATHGRDHSDHMLVGALALLATAASPRVPEVISYRGYNIATEPANADPTQYDRAARILGDYEACVRGCAPCGPACPARPLDEAHDAWLRRRYAIGVQRRASGQLRQGDRCVDVASVGGNATLVDCAGAPSWTFDDDGLLRASTGLCLQTLFTGEIIANTCGVGGAGGRFFLDDDGHVWTGIVPPAHDDLALAHLVCLGTAGGRPRAALCGDGRAPVWELTRAMTATPRDTTTLTRTGRAVRMARLLRGQPATVCAVEPGARGLMCAPGAADGALSPAIRIDDRARPLAIVPESLAFGDVDRDGLTDACGRDASGILCATAATGYVAQRWASTLGTSGPASATDRSLSIAPDGTICALAGRGVVCLPRDAATLNRARSRWPDRRAALWFVDLDGDHQADWCAATPIGPACSLAADAPTTTSGVPWAYALRGVIEASAGDGPVPDTAIAVFTDTDGDGRDDLCRLRGDVITCARSHGRGFGPQAPVARLPAGLAPTALWAEPGHGGAAPRLCAADAATIACTD